MFQRLHPPTEAHTIWTLARSRPHPPAQVFVQVDMLYVSMEVNGHKIKAFIDSGAQVYLSGAISRTCQEGTHTGTCWSGTLYMC